MSNFNFSDLNSMTLRDKILENPEGKLRKAMLLRQGVAPRAGAWIETFKFQGDSGGTPLGAIYVPIRSLRRLSKPPEMPLIPTTARLKERCQK
jgi:hypothetical protein